MPGYQLVMAGGTFIDAVLSADGPLREPHVVFLPRRDALDLM